MEDRDIGQFTQNRPPIEYRCVTRGPTGPRPCFHLMDPSCRDAVQAGVKIAYGTDAGVYSHGWNAKQFTKMVE